MALVFEERDGFGNYVYIDQETGNRQVSPTVIEGAIGNIQELGDLTGSVGQTTFVDGEFEGGGLYNQSGVAQSMKYEVEDGKLVDSGQAVRSYFNKWSLFKYRSFANGSSVNDSNFDVNAYRTADVNRYTLNPTANNIVNWCRDNGSLGYSYNFSDFLQCEYYGKVSNNYMLTLRRFPYPVDDDILTPKTFGKDGSPIESHQPDVARAISWMSPTIGNELANILNFGVGFNWKSVEAGIQEVTPRSGRGKIGEKIAGSALLSTLEGSMSGYNYSEIAEIRRQGAGFDPLSQTYPNAVFGPLNVIDEMLVRDRGLKFDQSFSLTFNYEIRGYGKTSPKAAFMDTMANLLVLTYNNAPFWGGAVRKLSNGQLGPPFGDYDQLRSGNYKGFVNSLMDQFTSATSGINTDSFGGFVDSVKQQFADSKIMDNIIGGSLMELFDGPQGATILNAFITGEPTGQWHLTIGNPLNPIATIGNLTLDNAKFELEGPLGYEDFPTKLKVTIDLKPGRPRDKSDIESMFNAGRGRMYLQPDGERGIEYTNTSAYGGDAERFLNTSLKRAVSNLSYG